MCIYVYLCLCILNINVKLIIRIDTSKSNWGKEGSTWSLLYLCSFFTTITPPSPRSQWSHIFSFAVSRDTSYTTDLVLKMFGIVLTCVIVPPAVYTVKFIVWFHFWFWEIPFSVEFCAILSWFPSLIYNMRNIQRGLVLPFLPCCPVSSLPICAIWKKYGLSLRYLLL